MSATQPTIEDITDLQSLISLPDACVTLEDADVLFDLAGRAKAHLNTVWTLSALIPVKSGHDP